MMSEALGKISFAFVFIGFHVTFLIQHSAGLSGMPRRIFEYSDHSWTAYNLISTVGSYLLAIGVRRGRRSNTYRVLARRDEVAVEYDGPKVIDLRETVSATSV